MPSLDVSSYKLNLLYSYTFYNIAFNCDFTVPSSVVSIQSCFNKNGCFRNIKIPTTLSSLQNECFGADTNEAVSNFYLQTVEFESETPPTFGTNVFALQNLSNGMKIYVPDVSVDVYKAASGMTPYVDIILPKSQMD